MSDSQVKTAYEAFEAIRDGYGKLTHERFMKRGGSGIYRRVIQWVPSCGPGSINRNLQRCETLTSSLGGLKTLHHLMDIGKPGRLRVRVGSCHRCEACQRQDYGNCTDFQFVGQTEVIQLRPKESASVRIGRNALNELGKKLASEAELGEIIAVELAFDSEPFMMGEKLSEPYQVTEDFESYLGQFKTGDMVVKVRKMEPLSPGSSHFEHTDKVFPVFAEDIRKRNMQLHLTAVDHSRRSARVAETDGVYSGQQRQKQWHVLSAEGKLAVLKLISADELVGDRRDLATLAQ